ncbi:MAG: hypothetical protein AAF495_15385 [Pseudomonadota bacterium]
MSPRKHGRLLSATLATGLLLAPSIAGAGALQGPEVVNVNVNFSSQLPLSDLSDETLARAQKAGRKLIYRMIRDECDVLKSVVARTCRLTNLNVNAQVRTQHNPPTLQLYINGGGNFSITLKGEDE